MHMLAPGAIENRPGHHKTVLDYARHEPADLVGPEEVDEADRLRVRRHKAECGAPVSALSEPEIRRHAGSARPVVSAVTRDVAGP